MQYLKHKFIFIIGNSRSGTTMLSRILGLNKDIYTFQEIHFFERMIASNKLNDTIIVIIDGYHENL